MDGLATSRCGLSASFRTTRSLSSSGGKRTRMARSRSFADHVHLPVGALQQHLDLGTLFHEARDHLTELEIDHRGRATHPHHALRLRTHPVDGLLRGVGLHHHRNAVPVIFPADLGNGEPPRRAVDEPDAEAILQEADAAAQPRPRHAELAGRRGEAVLLDHLGKEVQIVEVLHGAHCPIFRTL